MPIRIIIPVGFFAAIYSTQVGAEDGPAQVTPTVAPVPANALHTRYHYSPATGAATAVGGGAVIEPGDIVYSNTPAPDLFLALGVPGLRVADDLTTVAVGGCPIKAYEFTVAGGGDGTGPPFGVAFNLYDGCPSQGGQLVPLAGGAVTAPHDGLVTVFVDLSAAPVTTSHTVWLAVSVDSSTAGWVVGRPAELGFTRNVYDFLYQQCDAHFGGTDLYAGFDARVYCQQPFDREFYAYYNADLSASTREFEADEWIMDDVELIVDDCVLSSYEIGALGVGMTDVLVTAEMRRACAPDFVIEGTQGTDQFFGDASPSLARFDFPSGVDLGVGASFWMAYKFDRAARAIRSGEAVLGFTEDHFGMENEAGGCDLVWFGGNPYAGFAINIRCLGDPPVGACCDLATPDANTPREFCREVTEFSCQGAQVRFETGAKCPQTCLITGDDCVDDADCPLACSGSQETCSDMSDCPPGETCDVTQPCVDLGVSFSPACGTAACCTPPEGPNGEGCSNLFEDECLAITDSEGRAAVWHPGHLCEYEDFDCVNWVCQFASGSCHVPHGTPGCDVPTCCAAICQEDAFCCEVEWDESCTDGTASFVGCATVPISNDHCWDPDPAFGAIEVAMNSSLEFDNSDVHLVADEGYSCHPSGPGVPGYGGVWFKFVATEGTARIDTCGSFDQEPQDSIIEVFSVGDPTTEETACNSLQSIGCNDDGGCCRSAGLSNVCVSGLTPGDTYYVLAGIKYSSAKGRYRLSVRSACEAEPPSCPRVLYVDRDATERPFDGTSWCSAFTTVQDALYGALPGDEIRVANGVYTPDRGYGREVGRRGETHRLVGGTTVLGGFAGCGSPDPDARDIITYESVLSGDLAGNDTGGLSDQSRNENSYRVVTAGLFFAGVLPAVVLDGFTIRGGEGYRIGSPPTSSGEGGGLICLTDEGVTVRNCTFIENQSGDGGAIYYWGDSMTLENCQFINNRADASGGGIYCGSYHDISLSHCVFRGNSARGGGGFFTFRGHPVLVDCLFEGNFAAGDGGGGVLVEGGWTDLTNCTFVGNHSGSAGGGLLRGIFSNSGAPGDDGPGGDSDASARLTLTTVTNSIFRRNMPDQVYGDEYYLQIRYSAIEGGWPGPGNTGADPLFVPGPAGCNYLSQIDAGGYANSPCLDSGDGLATDLGVDMRTTRADEVTDTGVVDRGYHYPVSGLPLVMGDYDRDGSLTLADVAAMQNCFTGEGPADLPPCCRIFDFEPDGGVRLDDFEAFRTNFDGP